MSIVYEKDPTLPDVDIIIPVRNEVKTLPEFLDALRTQTLWAHRIIIADGMSDDGTRDLLYKASLDDERIVLVDNPGRIVPAALNVALSQVESPLVARMDTHALYAPDYLERIVRVFVDHDEVWGAGGAMSTHGRGRWGHAIASTLGRSFGLGGARHRVEGAGGTIPHVFSGCYRTARLREIGGWDERFRANEDFEADTRLRKAGGEVWLEPAAKTKWFVRDAPGSLFIQMWRYGYYKGLTLHLHPDSLQPRQLAPPVLVLGLVVGAMIDRRRAIAAGLVYTAAAGSLGAAAARKDGNSTVLGAAVPPIVHLSWGAGLLAGLVRFTVRGPASRSSRGSGPQSNNG